MSMKVGLGACQEDLEVQGEIDFDFFEHDETVVQPRAVSAWTDDVEKCTPSPGDELPQIVTPAIITTCPPESGAHTKVICLETVIPSPEDYHCKASGSADSKDNGRKNLCFSSFSPNRVQFDSEDALGSPLSSSSASEFSSSSSFSISDDDSLTDSMTDVSPLPSNCHSPMVPRRETKFDFSPSSVECSSQGKCQKEGAKFLGDAHENKTHLHKTVKVNQLMKAIKQLEIDQNTNKHKTKANDGLPFAVNGKHKKNPSFTNEEVRKIDQENQRLLRKILVQQKRTKPIVGPVHTRPSSSSINRHKQQRQIELDNMALLQRLESAKPSKELNRSHLLNEYKDRPSLLSPSLRPMSSASLPTSCRNSAHTSGRNSTLNVPLCNKVSNKQ